MVDKDGMAVALTTTVNLVFGSMVLDPETGIILNDEVSSHTSLTISSDCVRKMDDFAVPGTPNGFGLWPSPCTQLTLPSSRINNSQTITRSPVNAPYPQQHPQ